MEEKKKISFYFYLVFFNNGDLLRTKNLNINELEEVGFVKAVYKVSSETNWERDLFFDLIPEGSKIERIKYENRDSKINDDVCSDSGECR